MNWACTLCGSRDWPSKTTSCPLCRDYRHDPEDEPFGLEDELDEDEESESQLAITKTKPPHEQTTVLPKLPTD